MSLEEIRGRAGGNCDSRAKRIVLDGATPANGPVRTLMQELAHALGVDYRSYSREQGRSDRRQR